VVVILVRPDMHHLVQFSNITVVPASQLDAVFLPDRQRQLSTCTDENRRRPWYGLLLLARA
jgi:hypothetical protein